jgi:hypothetical protein
MGKKFDEAGEQIAGSLAERCASFASGRFAPFD